MIKNCALISGREDMSGDWLRSLVSTSCGAVLGVYQGEPRVSSVDPVSQTISLLQPFHNGLRCAVSEVTFSAMDIWS
ncbi:hypothetical protein GJAV_G00252160 [Gymnothorax javanicus]|nr:hypothetical protein GJAV_G00252160 [Gymnothorax javanicus]